MTQNFWGQTIRVKDVHKKMTIISSRFATFEVNLIVDQIQQLHIDTKCEPLSSPQEIHDALHEIIKHESMNFGYQIKCVNGGITIVGRFTENREMVITVEFFGRQIVKQSFALRGIWLLNN